MATALLIVGFAFAAFCVWLTVRIINRRERWAKWTLTVVVVVPTLYSLSFGPAYWACSDGRGRIRDDRGGAIFLHAYSPIIFVYQHQSGLSSDAIGWYLDLWGAP